jgi:hypothetical protein
MTRPDHIRPTPTRPNPIQTHQGRAQPLTWDDLPPSARMVLWFCMACTAAVVALLVGLFIAHLMTGAIAAMSDPIGGAPW